MDWRNPIRSLTWALTRATEQDLAGVESAVAQGLVGSDRGQPVRCRPTEAECFVVLFSQAWTGAELGFDDDGDESIEAETVVVTGPAGDACVYVSTQLLYRVPHPNRRFFLDVAAQRMRGKGESGRYEGRDSEDQELFDYEAAGALARVCGAAQRMSPEDALRAARMLSACVARLEAIAGNAFAAAAKCRPDRIGK
jgi:hypothetical protein